MRYELGHMLAMQVCGGKHGFDVVRFVLLSV